MLLLLRPAPQRISNPPSWHESQYGAKILLRHPPAGRGSDWCRRREDIGGFGGGSVIIVVVVEVSSADADFGIVVVVAVAGNAGDDDDGGDGHVATRGFVFEAERFPTPFAPFSANAELPLS